MSSRAAKRHWPGRDPVGERVVVFPGSRYGETIERTIVGVAGDVHELGLVEEREWESLYVPIDQVAAPLAVPIFSGGVLLLLRSEVGLDALAETVRSEIAAYDRAQPVGEARSMPEVVRRSAAPYRFRGAILGAFAALALMLAAVGIFGVMSVLAQARRRELAIRRALGSTTIALVRLIVRQGLLPIGAGLLLGWAGVVLSTRVVQSFLFGVTATNGVALGVAMLVLIAIALLATVAPAVRWAGADPMRELRFE